MQQSHYLNGIIQPPQTADSEREWAGRKAVALQSAKLNDPVSQMIANDFKHKKFHSEAEMLAYAKKYKEAREEALNTDINIVTIQAILVGIMEQHCRKAISKCQQEGIYVREVKKAVNEVADAVKKLRNQTARYEEEVLTPLMADYTMAALEKYRNTGSLMNGLQFGWMKANGGLIQDLFMMCLRLLQQTEHPEHANSVANLTVVDVLAQLSEAIAQQEAATISPSVSQFFQVRKPDTSYRDVIHRRVGFITKRVCGEKKNADKPIRKLSEHVNLIGQKLLNSYDILVKVVVDCKNDYFLFYVTYIMRLIQQGKFKGVVKRLVREDINYIDPTGCLYARCCIGLVQTGQGSAMV